VDSKDDTCILIMVSVYGKRNQLLFRNNDIANLN